MRSERAFAAVPKSIRIVLLAALVLQALTHALAPRPVASAKALDEPAPIAVMRVVALGEPVVLAQLLTLYLQAFDNQPGISIPFRDLDYPKVARWLRTILELDPVGQYPLLMAAQVYSQVPDPNRERVMLEFVHEEFQRDPERRWRWLAHAALIAHHRLHESGLALSYVRAIAEKANTAPGWARQLHIFFLENMGEVESARILLGGLLASGQVTDEREFRFLSGRLEAMKAAENLTPLAK